LKVINEAIAKAPIRKLKKTLLLIANPVSAQTHQERDQYTEVQTKITTASQKGDPLASAILGMKESASDAEIQQLLDQISQEEQKKNEVALMIVSLVGFLGEPAENNASASSTTQSQQGVENGASQQQQPVTFQTSTGAVVPPAPAYPGQSSGGFVKPPMPSSSVVDDAPSGPMTNSNGSMMRPTNAYNYSGIPPSARPTGYISPQTNQEEVE